MLNKLVIAALTLLLLALLISIATGNSFLITATERTYLDGKITANINDHRVFNTRIIETDAAQPIRESARLNAKPLDEELATLLQRTNSVAFLVIKDGELITEQYFGDYHDRSKTNSFSMAKTVTTLLLGIAIDEGLISGLEQKLTDFLPEFENDPLGKNATIGQLSLMNSGYEWVEHYYSPFSPTVELLYGPNINEFLLGGHFTAPPGEFWEYSSASTQLLGIVLERALTQSGAADSISDYLSRKIWRPLGMNDDALWHTDDSGMELVFCCINTNARNFAKLGMLMLQGGNWNGRQLVPTRFVEKMVQPVGTEYYGLSTWLNPTAAPAYYWFSGHLGQYIINIPQHNMVIVRLGETRDDNTDFREEELPLYIANALALAGVD